MSEDNKKQTPRDKNNNKPKIDLEKTRFILSKPSEIRTQEDLNVFINLTKDIKFFNSFESDYENKLVLQSCARLMKFEYVPKHKYVFKIDEMGNKFYLLIGGKVSIHIRLPKQQRPKQDSNVMLISQKQETEDDDQLSHFIDLGPGGAFGEKSLLENKPRAASVFCEENCYFGVLNKKDYLESLKEIEQRKLMKILNWYRSIPGFHLIQNNYMLKQIQLNNKEMQFNWGQTVFQEGDEKQHAYIIKEGEFEALKTFQNQNNPVQDDNHSNIKNFVPKNQLKQTKTIKLWSFVEKDMFGEEDEIMGQKRQYTVICKSLSGGKLIVIPKYNLCRRLLKSEECFLYFKEKAELRGQNLQRKVENQHDKMEKYENYFWRKKNQRFEDKYEQIEKKINKKNTNYFDSSNQQQLDNNTEISENNYTNTIVMNSEDDDLLDSKMSRRHGSIAVNNMQMSPFKRKGKNSQTHIDHFLEKSQEMGFLDKSSSLRGSLRQTTQKSIEQSKQNNINTSSSKFFQKRQTFASDFFSSPKKLVTTENQQQQQQSLWASNNYNNAKISQQGSMASVSSDSLQLAMEASNQVVMGKLQQQQQLQDQLLILQQQQKMEEDQNQQSDDYDEDKDLKFDLLKQGYQAKKNENFRWSNLQCGIEELRQIKLQQTLHSSKKLYCFVQQMGAGRYIREQLSKINQAIVPIIDNSNSKYQLKQDVLSYKSKIQDKLQSGNMSPADVAKERVIQYKKSRRGGVCNQSVSRNLESQQSKDESQINPQLTIRKSFMNEQLQQQIGSQQSLNEKQQQQLSNNQQSQFSSTQGFKKSIFLKPMGNNINDNNDNNGSINNGSTKDKQSKDSFNISLDMNQVYKQQQLDEKKKQELEFSKTLSDKVQEIYPSSKYQQKQEGYLNNNNNQNQNYNRQKSPFYSLQCSPKVQELNNQSSKGFNFDQQQYNDGSNLPRIKNLSSHNNNNNKGQIYKSQLSNSPYKLNFEKLHKYEKLQNNLSSYSSGLDSQRIQFLLSTISDSKRSRNYSNGKQYFSAFQSPDLKSRKQSFASSVNKEDLININSFSYKQIQGKLNQQNKESENKWRQYFFNHDQKIVDEKLDTDQEKERKKLYENISSKIYVKARCQSQKNWEDNDQNKYNNSKQYYKFQNQGNKKEEEVLDSGRQGKNNMFGRDINLFTNRNNKQDKQLYQKQIALNNTQSLIQYCRMNEGQKGNNKGRKLFKGLKNISQNISQNNELQIQSKNKSQKINDGQQIQDIILVQKKLQQI